MRIAGAVSVALASFVFALIAAFGVTYRATSGCEDVGIACREAEPVRAVVEGGVAIASLAFLLISLVRLATKSPSKPALPPFLFGISLFAVWLIVVTA